MGGNFGSKYEFYIFFRIPKYMKNNNWSGDPQQQRPPKMISDELFPTRNNNTNVKMDPKHLMHIFIV